MDVHFRIRISGNHNADFYICMGEAGLDLSKYQKKKAPTPRTLEHFSFQEY